MRRISVTSLEAFRRYIAGVSQFDTEANLLDVLSGRFEGNEFTYIGSAFHSIVEHGEEAYRVADGGYVLEVDGYAVLMDGLQVATALQYKHEYPAAFHEVSFGMDFLDGRFPLHVSGRLDLPHGDDIRDIKTKFSAPKGVNDCPAEGYIDSCQWRLYLQMTGADRFYFDVFQFDGYDKTKHGLDVRGLKLTRTEPIECLRYDAMEQDNRQLVDEFREYIHTKNLYNILKIKQ
jgi:hypothetical protein